MAEPHSGYTVGIETSGAIGSVALLKNGELVGERQLGETGRRHARTLVAELQALLTDAGIRPIDVGFVAVSIGPGSFTGLRVGVVCAKTWAYAIPTCQLVAVETFQAVIHRLPTRSSAAWVIDDALRGDVFAQKFESTPSGWISSGSSNLKTRVPLAACPPVRLISLHNWLAETTPGEIVSGPAAARFASELSDKQLSVAPAELHRPTAFAIGKMGIRLALEGKYADPFALNPLYIRRSAAEEKADSDAISP